MGSRIVVHLLVMGLVLVFWQLPASAAGISIKPAGQGVFSIDVEGLKDIAAVDLEIRYDVQTFDAPSIARGAALSSDVSFITNTAIPGEIRIILKRSRAITASGQVAVLRFTSISEVPGRLVSAHASLITTKGLSQPQPVRVVNALPITFPGTDPATDTTSTGTGSTPSAEVTAGDATPPIPGGRTDQRDKIDDRFTGRGIADTTVTFADPGSGEVKSSPAALPVSPVPPSSTVPTAPVTPPPPADSASTLKPAEQASAAPAQSIVYGRVVDRFRDSSDVTSSAALMALFTPQADQKVTQQPAVAISDGRTVVTLRIELPRSFEGTPVFAVTRARMLSSGRDGAGAWTVQVLPDADTLDAVFIAYFGESMIQYPLVVAPPADRIPGAAPPLEEAGFALFLKERAKGGKPRFDLNGDGKRDYLDDYIYTANFIARVRQAGEPVAQPPKRTDK